MIHILVTGSNGQLGRDLQQLAIQYPGFDIDFTDVDDLDITNIDELNNFLKDKSYNFIINCAAYTAVDKAEREKEAAFLVNATGPKNLATVAKKHNIKLIHVSTDYVFDGTNNTPYHEKEPPKPDSIYGQSKLEGELRIAETNCKAIIIRTSWLYSSFGANFVKTMIRLGKERDELKVVFDQTGSPTYSGDLAEAILEIVNNSIQTTGEFFDGIYHFSNEGVCSWYDFAIAIMEISGLNCIIEPIDTKEFPTPAKRPAYSVMNKRKIKQTYNIKIPYWRDSLKRCIKQLDTA